MNYQHLLIARIAASQGAFAGGPGELALDADETVNFIRSLKAIDTRIFEAKYPGLKMRNWVAKVPLADDGANSYAFHSYDITGMAEMITNYSDDLPSVSALGTEDSVPLRVFGTSYSFSIEDMKRAARGYDLPAQLPVAARTVCERSIDYQLALGNVRAGTKGLFNNANVAVTTPTTGSWTTATGVANIVADIDKCVAEYETANKNVHGVTHILIPRSTWRFLGKERSDSSDKTALQMLQDRYPGVVIDWSALLETAGAGGVKRLVLGEFADMNQGALIPREFTQEPPQVKNLKTVVPCHFKSGGVVVYYPLSLRYMDGI